MLITRFTTEMFMTIDTLYTSVAIKVIYGRIYRDFEMKVNSNGKIQTSIQCDAGASSVGQ